MLALASRKDVIIDCCSSSFMIDGMGEDEALNSAATNREKPLHPFRLRRAGDDCRVKLQLAKPQVADERGELAHEGGRADGHAEVLEQRVILKRDCARRDDGAAAARHRGNALAADLVRAGASEWSQGFRRTS